MRFRTLTLLLWIFANSSPLGAAPQETESAEYSRRIWRTEDGLPQNKIQAITQTPEGYLWIGTSGGLVRFDGAKFVVFDRLNTPALGDDSILSLCPGNDGSLWIGTEGGGLAQMKSGVFRNYGQNEGPSNAFVRAVLQDRAGRVWVGTDRGFFRWDGMRFLRLDGQEGIPIMPVRTIYEDGAGTVWVSASTGIYSMRGDRPVRAGGEYANASDVTGIFESPDGCLWLAADSGLHRLVRGARAPDARVESIRARAVIGDDAQHLWIGSFGQGLIHYANGRATVYGSDFLPDNSVLALFQDREQNLWVGTQDGLLRMTRSALRTVTKHDGLAEDNVVTVFEDPAGTLWIGAFNGKLHRS
jgi:ligand-binding sensor domain-containing protein